jgi:hypothetical protein
MKKMVREELVRGHSDFRPVERPCKACLARKQKRASVLVQAQYYAEHVLELVHGDLHSKILPPTPVGNQYFHLMVDDKSRFMSTPLLPMKDRAPKAFKGFQLRAEAETREKLGGLCTDCGGEFNSASFIEYCRDCNILCYGYPNYCH